MDTIAENWLQDHMLDAVQFSAYAIGTDVRDGLDTNWKMKKLG